MISQILYKSYSKYEKYGLGRKVVISVWSCTWAPSSLRPRPRPWPWPCFRGLRNGYGSIRNWSGKRGGVLENESSFYLGWCDNRIIVARVKIKITACVYNHYEYTQYYYCNYQSRQTQVFIYPNDGTGPERHGLDCTEEPACYYFFYL